MTSRIFKSAVLAVFALGMLGFGSVALAEAGGGVKTENFSKPEIEKIIHDFIMENPQLLLDAVDGLQKKGVRVQQGRGLEKNKDLLFKDATSPTVGSADADVVVVEFMDYNCHFCKDALPTVKAMLEKDKKVRFIFKDFPILGPTSETAAKWALAAQMQKKYFEFHAALMSNKTPISDELLEKTAGDLGMNVEQAKKDIAGTDITLQIEKNRTLASELAISGTPAFIVGDEITPGAITVEEMEKKIANYRDKKKDQK